MPWRWPPLPRIGDGKMMNRSLVYVVGLGPGGAQYLTAQAQTALQAADVLCGYTVYIDLVRPLYPDKEVYATGMTRELDRCRWALETAKGGKTVALVCSGDAGVYGMASPLLELAEHCPEVEVEIVPGLTAALSGAAVLGAPLAHDFCVISLSDRLTPWAVIEKRLACAAAGISVWRSTTRRPKAAPTTCKRPFVFCGTTARARTRSPGWCAALAVTARPHGC